MSDHTTTWPELAIGLYDRLTDRNARISYQFEQMRVGVPSGTGNEASHADWMIDGTITLSTRTVEDPAAG